MCNIILTIIRFFFNMLYRWHQFETWDCSPIDTSIIFWIGHQKKKEHYGCDNTKQKLEKKSTLELFLEFPYQYTRLVSLSSG